MQIYGLFYQAKIENIFLIVYNSNITFYRINILQNSFYLLSTGCPYLNHTFIKVLAIAITKVTIGIKKFALHSVTTSLI